MGRTAGITLELPQEHGAPAAVTCNVHGRRMVRDELRMQWYCTEQGCDSGLTDESVARWEPR